MILNTWLNLCLTVQFIWLSIQFPIIFKEIWMVHNLVFLELDINNWHLISGIISFWVNPIQVEKFQLINYNNLENHFCIGILLISDVLEKIWLKITWQWVCSIMLLFGKMNTINGHDLSIVMGLLKYKIKKCQNPKVTL